MEQFYRYDQRSFMRENTLRVLCSNVRGLVCNWHHAVSFDWEQYDIVAFNEVWNIKEFENLQVEGFEIKSIRLRVNGRGGGTVIFGKKQLITKTLLTPFIEGVVESTGIKIGDINFINIYRPPSGSKDAFVDSLMQYLDNLGGQKILIGGDFNLNVNGGNTWINSICSVYGLEAKISGITRVSSGSSIDNYLTNLDGLFKISHISIADHLAITAHIKLNVKNKKDKEVHYYREMQEHNWIEFNHLVHNLTVEEGELEQKWSTLLDDIQKIVEKSFPLKQSKHKHFVMSRGLLKSRNKKNKLLKQYKQGIVSKEIYIRYNNIYRKLVKTEQLKAVANKLELAGADGKKKWKAIKETLHMQKK